MKQIAEFSLSSLQKFITKTFTVLVLVGTVSAQHVLGQVSDNFSDGNFTTNPGWSGNTSDFIINASQQLQLNNTIAATSYLSTPFSASSLNDFSWEFFVKQTFAASASNFGRIYLTSDQANLTSPLNGYYLQFGEAGSNDAVELFRQTGTNVASVCRGTNAAIASSFSIRIKVTRNNSGLWKLLVDYTGGSNFVLEASGTDNTYNTSSFCGLRCTYTATNSAKFFYDDFSITPSTIPDTTPPDIQTVTVLSSNQLSVLFSENLDLVSAGTLANFTVSNGVGNPQTAVLQPDGRTVLLTFAIPFPNGIQRTLVAEFVKDVTGNAMVSAQKSFLFFQPSPARFKDIIITELFADPSPAIGLPEAEFVEVYNRSTHPFDLANWKITDGSSTANLASLILLPGEYLILSSTSALPQFAAFGKTMGASNFPSLNNSGDAIVLKDQLGLTIDSVKYSSTWYGDDDKKDGGWSLELKDPENFCAESKNWTASNHSVGGTPGMQNSVYSINPDITGPKLLSITAQTSSLLILEFDEKLNKSLPAIADFITEPHLEISSVAFVDPTLTKLTLTLTTAVETTKTYRIETHIYDCPGNLIQENFKTAFLKLDNTAPVLQSLNVLSSTELEVLFSEKLDKSTAENILNYEVGNEIGSPVSAMLKSDGQIVSLLFSQPFTNGIDQILTVKNTTDLAGNSTVPIERTFMFFKATEPNFKDIIITEIFADPTPIVGLPETEFIEIYNRSENPFDLSGWKLTDGSSTATLPARILLPQEYLILCSSSSVSKLQVLGKVLGASSFPSLNNTGDVLVLKDPFGTKIDSVHYADTWYKDDEKKDGGWTLELIDPANICAESENWVAAENESGGTPGKQNSVFAEKPDLTGPRLQSAILTNDRTLVLQFNEKLEKRVPSLDNFLIAPLMLLDKIAFTDGSLTSIALSFSESFSGGVKYEVTASGIYDCAGNMISTDFNHIEFALPEEADSLDLVINEILFNPRPTGVDFIEVYNRSDKFINLKGWKIANITNGTIEHSQSIIEKDFLVPPHDYLVLTENSNVLKGEYVNGVEAKFLNTDLLSLPDDEGSIALITEKGKIIDHFSYTSKLHSVFIKDEEGVSLERIDFNLLTNESQNWKSASSSEGFATPGYLNSNFRTSSPFSENSILIEPEIFAPVNGQPDYAQIKYNFEKVGYVANVRIFDPAGREIRQLANNELLGTEGFFRWDGEQTNGSKARVGAYMVWFEVFDDQGEVKTFRKRVVVAPHP